MAFKIEVSIGTLKGALKLFLEICKSPKTLQGSDWVLQQVK